jgi:hypothetical protein
MVPIIDLLSIFYAGEALSEKMPNSLPYAGEVLSEKIVQKSEHLDLVEFV